MEERERESETERDRERRERDRQTDREGVKGQTRRYGKRYIRLFYLMARMTH